MSGDTEKTKKALCPHGKNPTACLDCEVDRNRPVSKVDHPSHYRTRGGGFEVIDVIEAFECDFKIGTAIEYLLRAGRKTGESLETDLNKSLWYIRRALQVAGGKDEVMERSIRDAVEAAYVRPFAVKVHFFNSEAEPRVTACGLDAITVNRTGAAESVTCPDCKKAVETGEIPGKSG